MEERDAKKRSLIERVTKKVLGRMPRDKKGVGKERGRRKGGCAGGDGGRER